MDSYNYSLLAVPCAWALSITPHWYAVYISKTSRDMPGFKNVAPREFLASCRALEKQSPDVKKYLRAEAANANGFENLAFFASAVAIGNFANLPTETLNKLALLYLTSRTIFNFLYIFNTKEALSGLRSLAYLGGIGACFSMFIKAGAVLNGKRL